MIVLSSTTLSSSKQIFLFLILLLMSMPSIVQLRPIYTMSDTESMHRTTLPVNITFFNTTYPQSDTILIVIFDERTFVKSWFINLTKEDLNDSHPKNEIVSISSQITQNRATSLANSSNLNGCAVLLIELSIFCNQVYSINENTYALTFELNNKNFSLLKPDYMLRSLT